MTDISPASGNKPFGLGIWRIEPAINAISSDAGSVRLEPKLMRLLLLLARRGGQPVSKDEIIGDVWDGLAVTDDVLSQAISKLRRALGDDRKNPEYIETIWKLGYRCIAPASGLDSAGRPLAAPVVSPEGRGSGFKAIMLLFLLMGIAVAIVWGYLSLWVIETSAGFAGGDFRTITSFPGREFDPAMSPDGSRVAYSHASDIFVTPVSGAGTIQLTSSSARDESPAWSPGGASIAFIRREGDDCEILSIPAIGGAATALADCQGNIYADLAWSPDGRNLALGSRARTGDSIAIRLIDLTTGDMRTVTSPPVGIWGDYDPVFSPDGTQLAFIRSWSEASQDVFFVSLADGREQQLTDERRNLFGLAWMAGEEAVLAASNRAGNYDLWRFPMEGAPELVLGGVSAPVNPSLDLAGETLVFEARSNDVNIWRVSLAGRELSGGEPSDGDQKTEASLLIASTKWDGHPSVSPDGTKVAFASNRSGAFEVWLADLGDNPRDEAQLTNLSAGFIGSPQWSADGKVLAFDARMAGNSRVYLLDLFDRLPRPVTDGGSNALNPTWRADGGLLFASDRDGEWSLWGRDGASGDEDRIVEGGFYGIEHGPSGDIYYARFSGPGLRRLRPSGDDQLIIPALAEGDWGSWRLAEDGANDGIVFIEREAGGDVGISKYIFADRTTHILATLPGYVPRGDGALALFPGGHIALVTQLDSQESDLVVITGVADR